MASLEYAVQVEGSKWNVFIGTLRKARFAVTTHRRQKFGANWQFPLRDYFMQRPGGCHRLPESVWASSKICGMLSPNRYKTEERYHEEGLPQRQRQHQR